MNQIKILKPEEKKFDLEERTYSFAKQIGSFNKEILIKSMENNEYFKQLIRSSGSVAANYIEANESFGKKDFQYRIKLCRKEAKESHLWLKLLNVNDEFLIDKQKKLIQEALELTKIFTSILEKTKIKNCPNFKH